MADSENRSGGQHRGHNNRKRRYRDEDDYDRKPQRRRHEEPVVRKLRNQLISMAEESLKQTQDEIRDLARLITDHCDEPDVKSFIYDLSVKLIIEQPFKIPFLAAVILYANETKPEVAKELLSEAEKKAETLLNEGNWRGFKLLLRFFACLQRLFEGDGIFPILDGLFDRVVDLQAASQDDVVGLELTKIILLTIPYVLASSPPGLEPKVLELLEKTNIVASVPHPLESLAVAYPGDGGVTPPFGYNSVIGLLQKQLQRESERNWEFSCIPRIYSPTLAKDGSGEPIAITKHDFPGITLPSPVNAGPKPLFPEAYFSLYADQEVETVPPTTDIASCLLRDAVVDTINILDFNRIEVARFLINLDSFFAPGTFADRGVQFDRLRDAKDDTPTWKPEDLAIDAVFSQIFNLPKPEHKLVYYHSVITECCKAAPAAIAPSLGRAIRFLYRHLDAMDMELSFQFTDWFAHHLSNFEFRWKWAEWEEELGASNLHPKKAFIIGALEKEIRLSFAKRIRETLPLPYHFLIPEGKDKDTPDFKYNSDETPYATEARELLSLLRTKAPEEEIQQVMDKIQEQASSLGVADPLVPSTDAYVTCICFIGSKSLSHILSYITRSQERLRSVGAQSEAARRQIISSIVDYWKDQPGNFLNIVDKLLNFNVLTPMCVIQWALNDRLGTGEILSESWLYEMIAGTVGKVTNNVQKIASALMNPALAPEQLETLLNDTFPKEREAMRQLFAAIDEAAAGVAEGVANDGPGFEEGNGNLVKMWALRWQRVFSRKGGVEDVVVGERAVEAKIEAMHASDVAQEQNGVAMNDVEFVE